LRRFILPVLNYEKESQEIVLHKELTNLYTGENEQGKKNLKGYETVVYKISPALC